MSVMKLIEMTPTEEGFTIHPNENTFRILREIDSLLNLITIFGDGGTGKSFLLRSLVGTQEFVVGYGRDAVTHGADSLILTEQQNQMFGTLNGIKLGVVDLEGIGVDQDNNYHVKLLSPFLIASRVLILNVAPNAAGRFLGNELLQKLYAFSVISANLTQAVRGGNSFARLVIVLRDVIGDDDARTVEERRVKQDLFQPTPPNPVTQTFLANMGLRQAIVDLFGGINNISVVALPEPPGRRGELRNASDPSFQQGVDRLRRVIFDIVKQPHNYNAVPLTGRVLAEVLQKSINSLNNNVDNIFEGGMMGLIEARLIESAKQVALHRLSEILSNHITRGLLNPATVEADLREAVNKDVMKPFQAKTQLHRSAAAQRSIRAVNDEVDRRVVARINENNNAVTQIMLTASAEINRLQSQTTELLYARIRQNYQTISSNTITAEMNRLQQQVETLFRSRMTASRIDPTWSVYREKINSIQTEVQTKLQSILNELIAQERAVLRVKQQAERVFNRYVIDIWNNLPSLVFTKDNQEALRDVHAAHFQNISVKGITIMDMLRGEPLPLGIEGTLEDFRAAVRDLGAIEPRPRFPNFDTDLMRAQIAMQQGSSYLPMSSGNEFNDVPLGHMLAWCWNLVYKHKERRDAAIRMVQEISEGIEQHPDPTHANPSPNCGSGRSPRLINAIRGYVDVGFQTVAAINTQTFQTDFANSVNKPTNLSLQQRLEIARSICSQYGVVGQLREDWLNGVREMFQDDNFD